ncbi:hypothetical protein AB0M47_14440 [Hamadaea sp. NPDC051192]|uniref:WXG100 family type VII secretion target n=1 Tax=Hamadaea sp. NPDC051192 TaxID=3154940 RepID=UPI003439BBD0
MADLTHVPDPDGARTAAQRLDSAVGNLQDVVTEALNLVKSMEAQAPLFGGDEGGRKFRSNYDVSSGTIITSAQSLVDGLGTVGSVINKSVNGTSSTEDDNTRAIPS